MTEAAVFDRLTDELKRRKSYKKEDLGGARKVFMALHLDEATAKAACTSLSKLRSLDAVEFLAEKWSDIPSNLRYIFLRWRWEGKEKETAIPACLAMAAAIYPVDPSSATGFLEGGVASARLPTTARSYLVKGLRRYWIETGAGASRLPFEQLTWESLGSGWRWEFLAALVDAATSGPSENKSNKGKPGYRKSMLDWLAMLGRGLDGTPEAKRLEGLRQQLNRASASSAFASPTPATAASTEPVQEPSSQSGISATATRGTCAPTHDSRPMELREGGPTTDTDDAGVGFERVTAAGHRVYHHLNSLSEELRLYRDTMLRRIAELERRLRSASEAKEAAEAEIGQLRRDVQAEQVRYVSLESTAASYRDDRDEAKKQVVVLQRELQQVQEKLRCECERSVRLAESAEDDKRKHVKILEVERQEAKRIMGQKVAQAVLPDVRHLREIEQEPPSAEQAQFLRAVLGEMLKRLRSLEIPIGE